jgi:cell division protein FtsB
MSEETKVTENKKDGSGLKILLGCVCAFLIVLTILLAVGADQREIEIVNLENQYRVLLSENERLQNKIDTLSSAEQEPSQEIELLNTIGQAIQESKSVDLMIETENGKVHFVYEAK